MGSATGAIFAPLNGPPAATTVQNQLATLGQTQANTQAIQAEAQQRQLQNQQIQRDQADSATTRQFLQKHNGSFEEMLGDNDYLAAVQPATAIGIQKSIIENKKATADTLKLQADAQDAAAKAQAAHETLAANKAYALAKSGYSIPAIDATMLEMENNGLMDKQHAEAIRQTIAADPTKAQPIIDALALNSPARQKDAELATQAITAGAAQANAQTNAAKEAREGQAAQFELAQKTRAQAIAETAGLENPQLPPAQGQAAYAALAQKYPEVFKGLGPNWNPQAIAMLQRQGVPISAQPEWDIKSIEAAAMKNTNPQGDSLLVDSVIDPGQNADLNKETKARVAAIRSLGVPEPAKAIAAVLADASDQIGRTRTAVATANAEAPTKLGEAAINRRAMLDVEKYKSGSAAYAKSGQAYAGAVTAADDVQKVLDLAGSGNKAAGANVPLVGVGALNAVNGIKRINSAEIAQYGTAGSLLDRIQGKLQGWTEGQPIPKDVLADMKTLHDQLAQGAADKHSREVDVINKTFDQNFKPMQFGPAGGTTGKTATSTHVADYAKQKGISVDQAKKEFGAAGYTIK